MRPATAILLLAGALAASASGRSKSVSITVWDRGINQHGAKPILIEQPEDDILDRTPPDQLKQGLLRNLIGQVESGLDRGVSEFEIELVERLNTATYFLEANQRRTLAFLRAAHGATAELVSYLQARNIGVTRLHYYLGSNGTNGAWFIAATASESSRVDLVDGRVDKQGAQALIDRVGASHVRIFLTYGDWPAANATMAQAIPLLLDLASLTRLDVATLIEALKLATGGQPQEAIANLDTARALKEHAPALEVFLVERLAWPAHVPGTSHIAVIADEHRESRFIARRLHVNPATGEVFLSRPYLGYGKDFRLEGTELDARLIPLALTLGQYKTKLRRYLSDEEKLRYIDGELIILKEAAARLDADPNPRLRTLHTKLKREIAKAAAYLDEERGKVEIRLASKGRKRPRSLFEPCPRGTRDAPGDCRDRGEPDPWNCPDCGDDGGASNGGDGQNDSDDPDDADDPEDRGGPKAPDDHGNQRKPRGPTDPGDGGGGSGGNSSGSGNSISGGGSSSSNLSLDPLILAEDWTALADHPAAPTPLQAHALRALNRNNESLHRFLIGSSPEGLQDWLRWTDDFAARRGDLALAHYFKGDALARLERWDEAISEFQLALGQAPHQPLVLSALGVAFAGKGDFDQALVALTRAGRSGASLADAHAGLGALWIQFSRGPKGALEALDRALKISPDFAVALYLRGCLKSLLGRFDEARSDLERAMDKAGPLADLLRANFQELTRRITGEEETRQALARGENPGVVIDRHLTDIGRQGPGGIAGPLSRAMSLGSHFPQYQDRITSQLNQMSRTNPALALQIQSGLNQIRSWNSNLEALAPRYGAMAGTAPSDRLSQAWTHPAFKGSGRDLANLLSGRSTNSGPSTLNQRGLPPPGASTRAAPRTDPLFTNPFAKPLQRQHGDLYGGLNRVADQLDLLNKGLGAATGLGSAFGAGSTSWASWLGRTPLTLAAPMVRDAADALAGRYNPFTLRVPSAAADHVLGLIGSRTGNPWLAGAGDFTAGLSSWIGSRRAAPDLDATTHIGDGVATFVTTFSAGLLFGPVGAKVAGAVTPFALQAGRALTYGPMSWAYNTFAPGPQKARNNLLTEFRLFNSTRAAQGMPTLSLRERYGYDTLKGMGFTDAEIRSYDHPAGRSASSRGSFPPNLGPGALAGRGAQAFGASDFLRKTTQPPPFGGCMDVPGTRCAPAMADPGRTAARPLLPASDRMSQNLGRMSDLAGKALGQLPAAPKPGGFKTGLEEATWIDENWPFDTMYGLAYRPARPAAGAK
jgi:tetratricopeptide (TPR) repeat protein/uncharacterized membrane protein YgcG